MKRRWSLVPWDGMTEIVKVLEFGADKYSAGDWELRDDSYRMKLWEAAMRHLIAHREGQHYDPESNLPHLAHAACDVLMILALNLRDPEPKQLTFDWRETDD